MMRQIHHSILLFLISVNLFALAPRSELDGNINRVNEKVAVYLQSDRLQVQRALSEHDGEFLYQYLKNAPSGIRPDLLQYFWLSSNPANVSLPASLISLLDRYLGDDLIQNVISNHLFRYGITTSTIYFIETAIAEDLPLDAVMMLWKLAGSQGRVLDRTFQEIASDPDQKDYIKALEEYFSSIREPVSILEIGCGSQANLLNYFLRKYDSSVTLGCGIDPLLEKEREQSKLRLFKTVISGLPFHDDSFDLIYERDVLGYSNQNHRKYERNVLALLKILKTGGQIIFGYGNDISELKRIITPFQDQVSLIRKGDRLILIKVPPNSNQSIQIERILKEAA